MEKEPCTIPLRGCSYKAFCFVIGLPRNIRLTNITELSSVQQFNQNLVSVCFTDVPSTWCNLPTSKTFIAHSLWREKPKTFPFCTIYLWHPAIQCLENFSPFITLSKPLEATFSSASGNPRLSKSSPPTSPSILDVEFTWNWSCWKILIKLWRKNVNSRFTPVKCRLSLESGVVFCSVFFLLKLLPRLSPNFNAQSYLRKECFYKFTILTNSNY